MTPGNIIILNGASSAGKTTLLKALQSAFREPYLDAGIDKFIWMLPKRYLDPPLWQEVFQYTYDDAGAIVDIRAAARGHALMSGMHQSIAALARAGNNVVADHVLLEQAWVRECAALFASLPAWLVGVRCPLVVLIEREKQRLDRTLGQAAVQHAAAHAFTLYDLEIDTSMLDVAQCVAAIQHMVQSGNPPTAFQRIHSMHATDAHAPC